MTINLQKGQRINLEKTAYDLSCVTVGLGWDVNVSSPRSSIFKRAEENVFDLDAIAVLLNSNGKVEDTGDDSYENGDIIFYNSLNHSSGQIRLTGDNRDGEGDAGSDDEQIIVNLNKLPQKYDRILFLVSIYEGRKKRQHFGKVNNAFIRAVDAGGKEMFRYNLSNDKTFDGKCSMEFGELYRRDGGWKFRAIGTPYDTDRFYDIVSEKYC